MEDVRDIVVSLADDVGPFQPYVEVEEEEVMANSQGRPLTTDVDVQSDVRADPPPSESSDEIIVLEEDADVPLQPHAYSKVGKIPRGTYSRESVNRRRRGGPLLKRSYQGHLPSVGPKGNVNVVCPVVQSEAGSLAGGPADSVVGKPKRVRFID
jgi:hypothetical protein